MFVYSPFFARCSSAAHNSDQRLPLGPGIQVHREFELFPERFPLRGLRAVERGRRTTGQRGRQLLLLLLPLPGRVLPDGLGPAFLGRLLRWSSSRAFELAPDSIKVLAMGSASGPGGIGSEEGSRLGRRCCCWRCWCRGYKAVFLLLESRPGRRRANWDHGLGLGLLPFGGGGGRGWHLLMIVGLLLLLLILMLLMLML